MHDPELATAENKVCEPHEVTIFNSTTFTASIDSKQGYTVRKKEAKIISSWICELGLGTGDVCLNIGSSTKHFREVMQPHIYECLIKPLEEAGIHLIHCDMKAAEGVDLVGDVFDPGFQAAMADRHADVLLCCNILEHLTDARSFADACGNLVRPGGYMVVSVPLSYPYHPDPIDTMLRPTPHELQAFFPGWNQIVSEIVITETFLQESLQRKNGWANFIIHLFKVLAPFYRPKKWWPKAHRMLWLFRPYKSSICVLQKPVRMVRREA